MEQSITFQSHTPFKNMWDTMQDSVTILTALTSRIRQRLAFTSRMLSGFPE